MNRLEAMASFIAAVDAGSLSAGARKLGVPLATMSRRVADLEGHVKATLFIRTSRRLVLTPEGQAYAAACRDILAAVHEAESLAAGSTARPSGTLVVTAPVVFGRLNVVPVVVAFLQRYPDINVRLLLTNRVANFNDDHIDVALRIGPLPDSSLMVSALGEVRLAVCAAPHYLAAAPPLRQPADLAQQACITFSDLMADSYWTFGRGKGALKVPVQSRLSVNTAEAALDAAVAGLGVTRVLSYQMAEACAAGLLQRVLQDFEPAALPVNLVYVAQGVMAAKKKVFIDFASGHLRQRLRHLARH